jgi:hypothetical protein
VNANKYTVRIKVHSDGKLCVNLTGEAEMNIRMKTHEFWCESGTSTTTMLLPMMH